MMSRCVTITSLLAVAILSNTGLASEKYVLPLADQEVWFTAVPEQGFIQRTLDQGRKTEVKSSALQSARSLPTEVSYQAPLFSVNGQTVGVTPEIVVHVTPETSREELDSICTAMGLRLSRPMPFTTQEYVLEVLAPDAEAVFAAVQGLNEIESVEWAWPNLILYRDPDPHPVHEDPSYLELASATASTNGIVASQTFMEPNDPFFPDLWHLHNTGQTGGTPGADINALAAWEITTGDPNIVVAVIDTGVDMNHPDLAAALLPGYDFWDDDDCPEPLPDHGNAHGTMCAGLIGAQGNNGTGVVGVAWNCRIMPIRIDAWPWRVSGAEEAAIATALRWAAAQGADVISNSWLFYNPLPIIRSAIRDIGPSGGGLGRDGKGCTLLFAAGNEGTGMSSKYPANYPEAIAVGGTGYQDRRVSYSNHGPELDLCAPGGNEPFTEELARGCIWTTDISGPSGWNTAPSGPYIPYPYSHIHDYGQAFGTSFATPQVAGVAALILSIEPELTSEEVRYFLTRSTKDLGDPGKDDYYGWGRLDARAALDLVLARRADLNDDWMVDERDLDLLQAYLDTNDPAGDIAPAARRDGVVDANDLVLLRQYLGMEIPEYGLLAHWQLDETERGIAHNSTGDPRLNAELHGDPTWRPTGGVVAGALQFDGIEDCLETPSILDPAEGPLSVFAWIKGGAPGQVIISQNSGSNWLAIDPESGGLMTAITPSLARNTSIEPLISDRVVTDDSWHRIALVWDGASRNLYVDGTLVATEEQPGLVSCTDGLNIGCGKERDPGTFFTGLIDDIRIYNRAVHPEPVPNNR